jgi:hypothetical protein
VKAATGNRRKLACFVQDTLVAAASGKLNESYLHAECTSFTMSAAVPEEPGQASGRPREASYFKLPSSTTPFAKRAPVDQR